MVPCPTNDLFRTPTILGVTYVADSTNQPKHEKVVVEDPPAILGSHIMQKIQPTPPPKKKKKSSSHSAMNQPSPHHGKQHKMAVAQRQLLPNKTCVTLHYMGYKATIQRGRTIHFLIPSYVD